MRLKHWAYGNSLKLYDKQRTVLRIETTLNNPRGYTVFRPAEGARHGGSRWRPLRQGIADLHRRTVLSQAANDRYAEALAAVRLPTALGTWLAGCTRPVHYRGRRVRGLQPWAAAELAVLRALSRGEFLLAGLRNRDVRTLLFPTATHCRAERRRRAAHVTRLLRLMRAHGVLRKVAHTRRYQVTVRGRGLITAVLAAHAANAEQLSTLAA